MEGQILVLTYPLVGNYGVPPEENDELGIPRLGFEGNSCRVQRLGVCISLQDCVLSASFFHEPLVVPQVFRRRQDFSRCGGGVGVLLRRVALLCRQELVPVARRATWQSLALGIVKTHLSKAIMIPQKGVRAKH